MSRIGKYPVAVPNGVTVELNGQDVKVKGPKGELARRVHDDVVVAVEDGESGRIIRLKPRTNDRRARALWPTWRTQINNMVIGVTDGYTKNLEIQGVGYRAQLQGREIVLQLGYSHEVRYPVPQGIDVQIEKQTQISIKGINKEHVGQMAAEIKALRPPEPYKGKGVRYEGEYIMRKEGKKK